MDIDPKKFFIGVIDFFSVLLPGALLTYELFVDPQTQILWGHYSELSGSAGWLAFFFSSYVLGHFVFLLGAAFLDDFLYDPIRNATRGKQIERLANGKASSPAWLRFLAPLFVKKDSDKTQRRVFKIMEHHTHSLGSCLGLNAFQWCKARLVLENHIEALETVRRFEADSKFFRSFAVVILIFVIWNIARQDYPIAFAAIFFFVLSLWRYIDQRLKGINQAYWYLLTLEAAASNGYREPENKNKLTASRAGGVVYRCKSEPGATPEYLIVGAKNTPSDWILPKGHIEPGESMKEAAVREVAEETGVWARVRSTLDMISFNLDGEHVAVQFFLMEKMAHSRPQEHREVRWRPINKAILEVTHDESRELLLQADKILFNLLNRRAPCN